MDNKISLNFFHRLVISSCFFGTFVYAYVVVATDPMKKAAASFATAAAARGPVSTTPTSRSVAHLTTTAAGAGAPVPASSGSGILQPTPTPTSLAHVSTSPVSRPCRLRSSAFSAHRSHYRSPLMFGARNFPASSLPFARRTLMQGAMATMPAAATSPHIPLSLAAARLWPASATTIGDEAGGYADSHLEEAAEEAARRHQRIMLASAAASSVSPKQALREKAFLQFDVGTAAYPHPKRVRCWFLLHAFSRECHMTISSSSIQN